MLLWLPIVVLGCINIEPSHGLNFASVGCKTDGNIDGFYEFFLSSSVPTYGATNISEDCYIHTQEYLAAFRDRQSWAVKMYESSGRMVEDLIYTESGNIHHQPGLFDECISIKPSDVPFQGKYCSVFFDLRPQSPSTRSTPESDPEAQASESFFEEEPEETVSYFQKTSVSFCIPSTCSAQDVRSAVAQRIGQHSRFVKRINSSVVTITNEDYCFTGEKSGGTRQLDTVAVVIFSIFLAFVLVILCATIHEAWLEKIADTTAARSQRKTFPVQTLHCFSAINNFRKLFTTEDSKDNLSCLHGIRVLSLFWVVVIHVCEETLNRYTHNKKSTQENIARWETQPITNGTIAVDTFFLLGGLVVTYTQLKKLARNNGQFNLKRFYIHRYIRLTPLYAAVLAFMASFFPYVGNGPDWNRVIKMSQIIRNYWWAHLLYISNYVPQVEKYIANPLTALSEAWYLAADMQMFWISPLFIYPLWRWRKAGLVWVIIMFLMFTGLSAIIFIVADLPPTLMFGRPSAQKGMEDYCRLIYLQVYARIQPYLLGIILGWILHKTKDKAVRLNWLQAIIGWTISGLVSLTVIFGLVPYLDESKAPTINPLFRVLYGSLHRSAWAATIGWLIFACVNGYGGFVNRFLSWKLFVPLARLCYAVYLTHFSIFFKAYSSHMRKPLYFTEIYLATIFLGTLAFNFILACFLSVTFELPFLNLDKLFFPENSSPSKGKSIEEKENIEEQMPMNLNSSQTATKL